MKYLRVRLCPVCNRPRPMRVYLQAILGAAYRKFICHHCGALVAGERVTK